MGNHAFYLSIPPKALPAGHRAAAGAQASPSSGDGRWRRVVIEKPFGSRPADARAS